MKDGTRSAPAFSRRSLLIRAIRGNDAPATLRQSPRPASPHLRDAPLGSVGYENQINERGEGLIWLDDAVVARLRATRGPGEGYSDVILRLTSESVV